MGNWLDRSRISKAITEANKNAGSTDINGGRTFTANSGRGYDSMVLIAQLGAIAGTATLALHWESSSDNATWNDIGSYELDIGVTDDNKLVIFELPTHLTTDPFVRVVFDKGTANSAIRWAHYIRWDCEENNPGTSGDHRNTIVEFN